MITLPKIGNTKLNSHFQCNIHELSMNTVAVLKYSGTTGIWDFNKIKDATY